MKAFPCFGTDGIRGLYGHYPVTPEGMWSLGWAVGRWIMDQGYPSPFVFVGRDTRASGPIIEEALSGGLTACGIKIFSVGCVPTPAISFLTRAHQASMGLMISASHNPFMYNGVKMFNGKGEKLSIAQEQAIAFYSAQSRNRSGAGVSIPQDPNFLTEYEAFLDQNTPELPPIKIVVDCAHGSYSAIAPRFLHNKGAVVVDVLGASPDGSNINAECGAVHPQQLTHALIHHQADVGISFDGDGDRIIVVTADGRVQDGDQILALLAQQYSLEATAWVDPEEPVVQPFLECPPSCPTPSFGVVGTVLSNLGLERFLQSKNIPFARTRVGDRWIAEKLKELGWVLGGESCGHIVLAKYLPTGDGLLAGLHILKHIGNHIDGSIGKTSSRCSSLFPIFQPMPSAMHNMTLRVPLFCENPKFLEYYHKLQSQSGPEERVLLRASGTEPVLRILVEGPCQDFVSDLAETIAKDLERQQCAIEEHRA